MARMHGVKVKMPVQFTEEDDEEFDLAAAEDIKQNAEI